MSSLTLESNGKPRRKHKLKHGSSTTPPQSPFISPLRFAPKKSILRISSPKATKSPLGVSRLLPGSLPLEAAEEENKTSKDIPWDENDDEDYPEVPKTPKPQHLKKKVGGLGGLGGADDDDESDGISSVSSGSVNGEIRIPKDDETDDGEEWEFKKFITTPEPKVPKRKRGSAGKKVGKLLGKHGKRFFKGVRKRVSQQENTTTTTTNINNLVEVPRQQQQQSLPSQQQSQQQSQELGSSSQQLQQETSSSQEVQRPNIIISKQEPQPPQPPQPQAEQSQPQQQQAEPSSQTPTLSLQPPPPTQQAQPAAATRKPPQTVLSPIRIKRLRKAQPPQSPDAESPVKAPPQILKGRHRNADGTPTVRSDALWTQTIMTGDSSSNNSDKDVEVEDYGAKGDKKQQEGEELPSNNNNNGSAEMTIRSDHLWAQNIIMTDNGHPTTEDGDSCGILTPELRSPKTPIGTSTPNMNATTSSSTAAPLSTLSRIPFLNSDDDEGNGDEGEEKDKMDASTGRSTNQTDTTTAASENPPTVTPADSSSSSSSSNSESGKGVIENSDLEDGNIVDEDDLLDLPSDEQDHDDLLQNNSMVQERDRNSSDYYLRQVLSEDEDEDEGGVVSEHDEELILEEQQQQRNSIMNNGPLPPPDQEDTMLSDILSHDSHSVLLPSDQEEEEEYMIPVASNHHEGNTVSAEEFEIEVVHSLSGNSVQEEDSNKPLPREVVGENILNTTISSNFTLDDSDLAEMEKKERPAISIGQRSTLTNMQHRLLSMRTIKDTYKRKLVMQEQESVQLQVQLLASQYEAKEAKMSLQNAQASLLHQQAKLQASENEREHQKELLRNLQEQLAIVTAQLQKKTNETNLLPRDATSSSFAGSGIQSDHSHDMKLANMEEQLLVQDEEMDQLAAQIQELKHKTAELEAAKGVAEQKWKEAVAREESLKAQTGQPMVDLEPISSNGEGVDNNDSDGKEVQRLEEMIKANEQRYETESAVLRKQLEDVQKDHQLEIAKLQEQIETNKKLAASAEEEAEVSRKQLLQELADSKLQHAQAIEELRESLSKTHQEEKSKLHTRYTNELERLEDEIVGSRSELSV